MSELNTEQIIKAMECCYDNNLSCIDCPFQDTSKYLECSNLTISALALIKELTARAEAQDIVISELRKLLDKANHDADRYARKIKELTEENETISKLLVEKTVTVIEFDKTIERLTEENEQLRKAFSRYEEYTGMNRLKGETVLKMQEKFNEKVAKLLISPSLQYQASAFIDQIAKELLEGCGDGNT